MCIRDRYFPDPLEPDRFDEEIEELGGIDTLVGGVGCKGLVAFNECPASPYHRVSLEEYAQSKSRIVTLREDTIIAYAEREFGACFDALPPNAFTIGMKSMLKAQRAVFVAVSYTHLDVYKRQPTAPPICSFFILPFGRRCF